MADWFAHSARHGRPTQSYAEHIANVTRGAIARARRMLRYYNAGDEGLPSKRALLAVAADAASYHDLGKLDDANQAVLGGRSAIGLPIRHEDAGVAALARQGALEAAGLVAAHHRGLPKYRFEPRRPGPRTRSEPPTLDASAFRAHVHAEHEATRVATDGSLTEYLLRHEQVLAQWCGRIESPLSQCTGLARRLSLSCLVDADHSDTSRHYGRAAPESRIEPRWEERLAALDRYIEELAKKARPGVDAASQERQAVRTDLYRACRDADVSHPLRTCDAVVGSGKTTAVMAHLLRVAATRKLRHIFVVLPYTNIIRQSVEVYRNALCLDGESPAEVVAEHHHQVEFKDVDLRHLTTLWRTPIIVTTAVQFFETLASNHTGQLRKLHEFPGSAVFLDEAHAALPSNLWPICWNWLVEWAEHWNGHLVLASGSLPEFWSLGEFAQLIEGREPGSAAQSLPADVRPLAPMLTKRMNEAEHSRVRFATRSDPMSGEDFASWVEQSPGPRLVIVNTVQSAAVLARLMQSRGSQGVLHISTALAPIHRGRVIDRIKEMLKYREDWTLVATSMVEAGLDFSFATGFRQRSSTASLVQTGGRVNRNAELGQESLVWDFDLADTATFPNNPAMKRAREALGQLFASAWLAPDRAPDVRAVCLQALRHEFSPKHQADALQAVRSEWPRMDYPEVKQVCRVISTDSRLVLIDRELLGSIRSGRGLAQPDLIARSVQMQPYKIAQLGLEPVLDSSQELYVLPEGWAYDPDFFGYMAGWFEREAAAIPGGYFV
jgi:CRISPR-associated endonuclease/helicase Cas3